MIMSSGLGRAELELATSFCAPLYWVIREDDGSRTVINGTAFFIDTGARVFCVTANHVLVALEEDRRTKDVLGVQLGLDLALDFKDRHCVIGRDPEVDIATFQISKREVRSLSKVVLTGSQKDWPPAPPETGKGIYFSGFPEGETRIISGEELSFGAVPGAGVADSISDKDVSTLIDRSRWIDPGLGSGLPPSNFDFSGMSGGPMMTVIERHGLRSWTLAGVIYQGPNSKADDLNCIAGFDVIRARRAHFIEPDGSIRAFQ